MIRFLNMHVGFKTRLPLLLFSFHLSLTNKGLHVYKEVGDQR